jgi:hypothetical protein
MNIQSFQVELLNKKKKNQEKNIQIFHQSLENNFSSQKLLALISELGRLKIPIFKSGGSSVIFLSERELFLCK